MGQHQKSCYRRSECAAAAAELSHQESLVLEKTKPAVVIRALLRQPELACRCGNSWFHDFEVDCFYCLPSSSNSRSFLHGTQLMTSVALPRTGNLHSRVMTSVEEALSWSRVFAHPRQSADHREDCGSFEESSSSTSSVFDDSPSVVPNLAMMHSVSEVQQPTSVQPGPPLQT